MKYIIGFAVCLAVFAVVGGGIVFSGIVSFKATEGHTGLVEAAISRVLHRSIAHHAADLQVPDLAEASQDNGLRLIEKNCGGCHSTPNKSAAEFAKHMSPRPPSLADHAGEMRPAEIFYIVKYGIMMSGMPAFGPMLSDEQLWEVVAGVKRLPDLDSDARQRSEDGHEHSH